MEKKQTPFKSCEQHCHVGGGLFLGVIRCRLCFLDGQHVKSQHLLFRKKRVSSLLTCNSSHFFILHKKSAWSLHTKNLDIWKDGIGVIAAWTNERTTTSARRSVTVMRFESPFADVNMTQWSSKRDFFPT